MFLHVQTAKNSGYWVQKLSVLKSCTCRIKITGVLQLVPLFFVEKSDEEVRELLTHMDPIHIT